MKQNNRFFSQGADRGFGRAAGALAVAGALMFSRGLTTTATAQTNAGSTQVPEQTFFNSVAQYFSGFDTNSTTFAADAVDVWAGADTVNNQNLAASLGLEILPFRSSSNSVLSQVSVESVTRNATVAGTVLSEQAGLGCNLTHFDTRVTGYVDAGYRFDTRQCYVAPGARVKKALTDNTYAGVGLELPVYLRGASGQSAGAPGPTLSVFTGFKF